MSSDNPYVVKASDLGMYLQGISTCTDAKGTELKNVGGLTQNVARPVLDEYDFYVDGVLHDQSTQLGMTPGSSAIFEVKPKGDANFPAKDVTFAWSIRTGSGRFSGDTDKAAVVYIANDTAPSAALVQCQYVSLHADDVGVASSEVLVAPAKSGVPVEDMIRSLNKPKLRQLVAASDWADAFDKDLFKLPIAQLREAVLAAYHLAQGDMRI